MGVYLHAGVFVFMRVYLGLLTHLSKTINSVEEKHLDLMVFN